jgi:DHA2 family lincomycin resistance protein-like MFS transporter
MTSDTISDFDAAAAPAPHDASFAARNKLVINVLLISTFVVMLNETAMTVAIPHLMAALNVEASAAQWLTTAFLLTMAVVIPVTGFLLQRLNTRPVFLLAMALFSLGTAIAAVSPGLELLIVGRVVQASGTAIMMPLLMTTVMTLVPPHERGKMMGNISIVMSVAPAIGPVLAGVILSYLDWRMLFVVMLPIGLLSLAIGYAKMLNVTTPRFAPLDIFSVVVSAIAFGGIVYGLSEYGVEAAARPFDPIYAVGAGVVAMVIFVARQLQLQKKDGALLDLRTFKSANFSISLVMLAVLMLAMFGTIILLPIYLAQIQGFDTWQIGLLLMPGALLMGLLGPQVGKLFDKVGPRPLIIPAMFVVVGVMWAMTLLGTTTWWPWILVGHIVMSIGFAFLFGPLFTTSLSSIQPQLYSHGSALLGSTQQVAGAAGVALFVALMSAQSMAGAAGGIDANEALASGIRLALVVGAVIAFVPLVLSFFVKRAAAPDWGGGHGGH